MSSKKSKHEDPKIALGEGETFELVLHDPAFYAPGVQRVLKTRAPSSTHGKKFTEKLREAIRALPAEIGISEERRQWIQGNRCVYATLAFAVIIGVNRRATHDESGERIATHLALLPVFLSVDPVFVGNLILSIAKTNEVPTNHYAMASAISQLHKDSSRLKFGDGINPAKDWTLAKSSHREIAEVAFRLSGLGKLNPFNGQPGEETVCKELPKLRRKIRECDDFWNNERGAQIGTPGKNAASQAAMLKLVKRHNERIQPR